MRGQHSQHWLTKKLADHIASSPGSGRERLSVSLLPRTVGPGLSQEHTDAEALQQLTAICNSFAAVATPDQVLLLTTTWKAWDLFENHAHLRMYEAAVSSM